MAVGSNPGMIAFTAAREAASSRDLSHLRALCGLAGHSRYSWNSGGTRPTLAVGDSVV